MKFATISVLLAACGLWVLSLHGCFFRPMLAAAPPAAGASACPPPPDSTGGVRRGTPTPADGHCCPPAPDAGYSDQGPKPPDVGNGKKCGGSHSGFPRTDRGCVERSGSTTGSRS